MLKAVKGMQDVWPQAGEPFLDTAVWRFIVETFGEALDAHGYGRVWLPTVESTALFARGIGEGTDIVGKEMYSFEDRGQRQLTLRPEGTAGAVRAFVEHRLDRGAETQRWWYFGPMFRAERPQKGRYRQFYQVGAELLGAATPLADAEIVALLHHTTEALGLGGDVALVLNSMGDADSREAFAAVIAEFGRSHGDRWCESCQSRLQTHPLRILDCKRPECKALVADAPAIDSVWSDAARAHMSQVEDILGALGVPFARDHRLVRGLDYYTGLVFEFRTQLLGAQDAVLGGGRYDGLVASLGGTSTPAVGFAAGIERLALLLASRREALHAKQVPALYLAAMDSGDRQVLALASALRKLGCAPVEVDVAGGRVKQQMRRADRSGARTALVLGLDEWASKKATLKDLRHGRCCDVSLEPTLLAEQICAWEADTAQT